LQVYALAPAKAQAVALETLRIWCSLAERLGMFALKVRPEQHNGTSDVAKGVAAC